MHHKTEVKTVRVVSIKSLCVTRDELCLMHRTRYEMRRAQPGCGYSNEGRYHLPTASSGFTAVEILIVVVIIAIAAMMAIPMMTSGASFQIRSAANVIAADLEYAKSMAISRGQSFSVVFDMTTDSYRIEDQGGTIIPHPVKKGFDYAVDFPSNSRLNRVDIANVAFEPGSSQTITFDYMGSPYSGPGTSNPLNSGAITLQAAGTSKTINIGPVTGFISIED